MKLAERTTKVSGSPTLKVGLEAARLRRSGVDVVDLGAGEPDFPTPEHAKDAAHSAINENFTKYTPNSGIEDLRIAIADRYRFDYGVEYELPETIVSAGGKQALYNVALALFGDGDEVITHAPGWPTIVEQIKLADATPVIVRTFAEHKFMIQSEAIVAAITPRTRGIIVNSPGNPTGALISEEELAVIAEAAVVHDIWIVLDLCYERLIYDDVPHNLPKVLTERMRDLTVLTGSASKAYAMTGWRCGWVLGPPPVIAACSAVQSHATSNVCSITQRAALSALTGPQDCVTDMLNDYRVRRDQASLWLQEDARISLVKPDGAFYLFPDISGVLSPDGLRTSADLAHALLTDAHVAVTPGEAFDAPGFLRISYATSIERLREGISRILDFLKTDTRIAN
ncbi:MAG: pyridoxal phosphate-dependent aminotransferase [Acidobacteriota bacterium]|nr:pyridoxal phosphate-dependent aminotransferase [Acidobacteriota bacterium]